MQVTAERERGLRASGRRRSLLFAALSLLLAVGMAQYYFGVVTPIRERRYKVKGGLTGNWSDLYPRWLGARELLLHGRNPYSAEVTREIQRGFYGRPLDASKPGDPTDSEAFAYPVYVVFLLAPFVRLSFSAVSTGFDAAMLVLTVASVPLWMVALRAHKRVWLVLLGTMFSYPVLDCLHLEQITLLVAGLLAGCFALLSWSQPPVRRPFGLGLAGVLLALASVKPQLTILIALFLIVWTLGEWRSRRWFAFGFAGVMTGLLIGAEVVLPGWLSYWREAANGYLSEHGPSLLVIGLGRPAGTAVGAAAVLACVGLFWSVRKEPAGSVRFTFAWVSALAITVILLPNASNGIYNYMVLVPAVVWLFEAGRTLARKNWRVRGLWWAAVGVLAGEWVVAAIVSLSGLISGGRFVHDTSWFELSPQLLAFLFPIALVLYVWSVMPTVWAQRT